MKLFQELRVLTVITRDEFNILSLEKAEPPHTHVGYLALSKNHRLFRANPEMRQFRPVLRLSLEPAGPNQSDVRLYLNSAMATKLIANTESAETRYTLLTTYPAYPTPIHQCASHLRFIMTESQFQFYRRLNRGTSLALHIDLESDTPLLVMPCSN